MIVTRSAKSVYMPRGAAADRVSDALNLARVGCTPDGHGFGDVLRQLKAGYANELMVAAEHLFCCSARRGSLLADPPYESGARVCGID